MRAVCRFFFGFEQLAPLRGVDWDIERGTSLLKLHPRSPRSGVGVVFAVAGAVLIVVGAPDTEDALDTDLLYRHLKRPIFLFVFFLCDSVCACHVIFFRALLTRSMRRACVFVRFPCLSMMLTLSLRTRLHFHHGFNTNVVGGISAPSPVCFVKVGEKEYLHSLLH